MNLLKVKGNVEMPCSILNYDSLFLTTF